MCMINALEIDEQICGDSSTKVGIKGNNKTILEKKHIVYLKYNNCIQQV